MKHLKDYILESYNENSSFAEYLIINCDYKYIVEPILNSNFDNITKSNENYDFICSNKDYNKIGIYYKTIYRKENTINIDPSLLNNGHIDTDKKNYKSFLVYIYDGNLCFVDSKEFNNKLDVTKVEPELKFELSENMKSLYNDVYDIYDHLDKNIRNSKKFKTFDEFKEIEELLK